MKKDKKDVKKPSSTKPAKGKDKELSSDELDQVSGGLIARPIYDGDPDGPYLP